MDAEQTGIAHEIAERNQDALLRWRLRCYLGLRFPDAWPPLRRQLLNGWYQVRRQAATDWLRRPQFLRRQAG